MKEYIADYIVPVEKQGRNYVPDFYNAKRLIRCEDCNDCMKTGFHNGIHWVFCGRFICFTKADDFCSKAEPKEKKND